MNGPSHNESVKSICIVTPEYPTEPYKAGGIVYHSAKVASWFAGHGYQVHVCVPAQTDESFDEHEGLRIHRYRPPNLWPWRLRKRFRRPYWLEYLELIMGTRKTVLALHKKDPLSIVHFFGGHLSIGLLRNPNFPVVVRSSGFTPEYYKTNFQEITKPIKLLVRLRKRALRLADAVYTSARRTAVRWEPLVKRPIPIIRTPMFELQDEERIIEPGAPHQPLEPYILFCSGMMGCKGADLAAAAMARILARYSDYHLVIVGRDNRSPEKDVRMSDYMKQQLEDVQSRCHFLGVVNHAEVAHWMRHAEFIIAPSRADNLPNVLLEAMWYAKVVIGTEDASFDEIIEDGIDGFIAKNGDVESLENKIVEAINAGEERRRVMGEKARAKARDLFNPDLVMNQILALYRDAISGR